MKAITIAIDGPAGAGKSSVAKIAAKKLGYTYLDTGAMYRAFTWYMQEQGVTCEETEKVQDLLRQVTIHLQGTKVTVNGKDVTDAIRSQKVSVYVSQVAALKEVRATLATWQKEIAKEGGVIVDGRDIGTVVLPNAELKLFLTASVEARALRRWKEMKEKGDLLSLEEIKANIEARDKQDTERKESPLRKAADAIVLDNSAWTLEETADRILTLAKGVIK